MMNAGTIGYALKKRGIARYEVVKTLAEKYDLVMSLSNFNNYARKHLCRNTQVWATIRECLEKEYEIVYRPTYWY